MKRKLILFITCFFLFSSLTVFFVYQRIRSPEVSKKENNEEVKKEETNENLTTKKDSLDKKEETDDLPWTFTWIGAVVSLILSFLIYIVIYYIVAVIKNNKNIEKEVEKINNDGNTVVFSPETKEKENNIDNTSEQNPDKNKNTLSLLFWSSLPAITFLYCFVFPAIFAIQKYKDKSYGERFDLINSSSTKIIFSGIFIVIVIIVGIISCCKDVEKEQQ